MKSQSTATALWAVSCPDAQWHACCQASKWSRLGWHPCQPRACKDSQLPSMVPGGAAGTLMSGTVLRLTCLHLVLTPASQHWASLHKMSRHLVPHTCWNIPRQAAAPVAQSPAVSSNLCIVSSTWCTSLFSAPCSLLSSDRLTDHSIVCVGCTVCGVACGWCSWRLLLRSDPSRRRL